MGKRLGTWVSMAQARISRRREELDAGPKGMHHPRGRSRWILGCRSGERGWEETESGSCTSGCVHLLRGEENSGRMEAARARASERARCAAAAGRANDPAKFLTPGTPIRISIVRAPLTIIQISKFY